MTIPPTQKNLDDLFLEAIRISLDRLRDDPDCPTTAREIINQMERLADWRFDIKSIKMLIESEGLSDGPDTIDRQTEDLIEQFRKADLVNITSGGMAVLPRGVALIHRHF